MFLYEDIWNINKIITNYKKYNITKVNIWWPSKALPLTFFF